MADDRMVALETVRKAPAAVNTGHRDRAPVGERPGPFDRRRLPPQRGSFSQSVCRWRQLFASVASSEPARLPLSTARAS